MDTSQLRRLGNSIQALATLIENNTVPDGSVSIGLARIIEELGDMQAEAEHEAYGQLLDSPQE